MKTRYFQGDYHPLIRVVNTKLTDASERILDPKTCGRKYCEDCEVVVVVSVVNSSCIIRLLLD